MATLTGGGGATVHEGLHQPHIEHTLPAELEPADGLTSLLADVDLRVVIRVPNLPVADVRGCSDRSCVEPVRAGTVFALSSDVASAFLTDYAGRVPGLRLS